MSIAKELEIPQNTVQDIERSILKKTTNTPVFDNAFLSFPNNQKFGAKKNVNHGSHL